jgi:hypothetical protein
MMPLAWPVVDWPWGETPDPRVEGNAGFWKHRLANALARSLMDPLTSSRSASPSMQRICMCTTHCSFHGGPRVIERDVLARVRGQFIL